jgi:hypothetical protein
MDLKTTFTDICEVLRSWNSREGLSVRLRLYQEGREDVTMTKHLAFQQLQEPVQM